MAKILNRFCKNCGARMKMEHVFANEYCVRTGDPLYHRRYRCPNRKRFGLFTHHDVWNKLPFSDKLTTHSRYEIKTLEVL